MTDIETDTHYEPIRGCIERWHQQVAGRLDGGMDAILHPDVVFLSPIVFTPQKGIDVTKEGHRLASQQAWHCAVAHMRSLAKTWSDEVAGASFGHADPPGVVSGQRVVPHLCPNRSLDARWIEWVSGPHRRYRLGIRVEIAQRDQRGAGGLGSLQQRLGQRWPIGSPAVIRRVRTVVDRRGSGCYLGQALLVRCVCSYPSYPWRRWARSRARHDGDMVAGCCE